MSFVAGEVLADGWTIERLAADGSVRFARSPSVDRRRATSRLVVMAGCFAVVLALSGVTAQSSDSLWLITWSLIALFGLTGALAALAAVKDLRRASLGVFLEVDVAARRVRGVLEGAGARQFSVIVSERPLGEVQLRLVPFEGANDGSGMLVCATASGEHLVSPDLPHVEDARRWLEMVAKIAPA